MNKQFKLMLGDNMISLKKLPDNSVDSIVTDPPYGLSFMGKKWDYDVPSIDFWKEVYRVLKPGGHILSFGGTRTYHRMVVNIEDAGFEIRDQIQWLYGSGFPKSHNIGKGVDKKLGNEREVVGEKIGKINLNDIKEGDKSFYENAWLSKNYINIDITKGQSEWEGWGTALKPANEPIVLARKPLSEKTIVDNIIKWGTGGINIDGCRVGYINDIDKEKAKPGSLNATGENSLFGLKSGNEQNNLGRFPANVILDEEAGILLDEQSGHSKSNTTKKIVDRGAVIFQDEEGNKLSGHKQKVYPNTINDEGGASRFFYQAKVSKKERNLGLDGFEDKGYSINQKHNSKTLEERYNLKTKNNHPTLKPINLMTYLCRLITPPNGVVLDPFMGSGSTGISALLEGFRFVGMEMDEGYYDIAEARIKNYELYRKLLKE